MFTRLYSCANFSTTKSYGWVLYRGYYQDKITNFSLEQSISGGGLSTVVETLTEEAAVSQHLRLQKLTKTNKQKTYDDMT